MGENLALGCGPAAVRGGEFLATDVAVMIGVEPVEDCVADSTPSASASRLPFCRSLRVDGIDLVLGDEAVMVGVELREHLADVAATSSRVIVVAVT